MHHVLTYYSSLSDFNAYYQCLRQLTKLVQINKDYLEQNYLALLFVGLFNWGFAGSRAQNSVGVTAVFLSSSLLSRFSVAFSASASSSLDSEGLAEC